MYRFQSTDFRAVDDGLLDVTMIALDGLAVQSASALSAKPVTLSMEDDIAADTSTTASIAVGASVVGSLETAGDRDWYAVEVVAGQRYDFSLESFSANGQAGVPDTFARLYGADGQLIEEDDDGGNGLNSLISYVATEDGTVYFSASALGDSDSGSYRVSVTAIEDDFTDDASTTGVVNIDGAALTGRIDFRDDADWFAFDIAEQSTLLIEPVGNDTFLNLIVLDSNGSEVSFIGSEGGAVSLGLLGTYYLSVSAFEAGTDYSINVTTIEDDFQDNISTTGALSLEGSADGTIDFGSDADWFRLDIADSGALVEFTLTGAAANLAIYDTDGNIALFGDFPAQPAFFEDAGTYFVGVFGQGGTGSYTVSATQGEDDFAGNTSTTGEIAIGGTVSGAIQFEGDEDWFAFDVSAGDTVNFSVASDTFFDLAIRDSSGNFVDSSFNGDINFNTATSGTFYLSVSGFNLGSYTLTATAQEDDFAGDASTTGSIEVGQTVSGSIQFQQDDDWFAFEASAGDIIDFALGEGTFVDLQVIDSSGQNVLASSFGDDLAFTTETTGSFFLSVSGFDVQDYTLTASAITDDFADNTTTTGEIQLGQTVSGRIDFDNDADWFRFDADAGQVLRFTLDTGDFIQAQGIYDANGMFVASLDTFIDGTATFAVDVSGTYYASIVDDFDAAGGTYQLSLSEVDDDYGDTRATATQIGEGTITGNIYGEGDRDVFAIDVEVGQTYTFSLGGNGGFVDAFIGDANGGFIAPISDFGDDASFTSFYYGQIFVSVTGFEEADYSLSLDIQAPILPARLSTSSFGQANDFQLSADGSTIWIATEAGFLLSYDVASDSFGEPVVFGGSLDDIAVSADGGTLLLTQRGLIPTGDGETSSALIHTYDLLSGETGRILIPFAEASPSVPAYDVETLSDGSLLVLNRENFGSELVVVSPDGTVSGRLELFNSDAEVLLLNDMRAVVFNNSDITLIDLGTFQSIASASVFEFAGFSGQGPSAVSQASGQILLGNFLLDDNLRLVRDLTEAFDAPSSQSGTFQASEVIFDTRGTQIFAFQNNGNQPSVLRVIDVETGAPAFDVVLPFAFGNSFPVLDGLSLSDDGTTLVVGARGQFVTLDLTEFPAMREGTSGADTLFGGVAGDTLSGLGGNDVLIGQQGADTIDGGSGNDMVSYITSTEGVRVNLDSGRVSGGDADGDTLISIEWATGSQFNDVMFARAAGSRLFGEDGDDALFGRDGNDRLDGGNGNDRLFGRDGDDLIFGRDGNDVLVGEAGNDRVFGGDGNDFLSGENGNDVLIGDAGNDRLLGGAGDDSLNGGEGDDVLFGNAGRDSLFGGIGRDTLVGGAGNDRVFGGDGNDTLRGNAGVDSILGGNGDDVIIGGADSDNLFGDAGRDVLIGGEGNDRMFGGEGVDFLYGGIGNDSLLGQDGIDRLEGQDGNDFLSGGNGDDVLVGGAGSDRLFGGADNDSLLGGTGGDVLIGGDGMDRLEGNDGNDLLDGGTGEDVLVGGAGADRLLGRDGDDSLSGGAGRDVIFGGEGFDTLFGGADVDVIYGGGGDDRIFGGDGDDTIYGNAGDDTIFADGGNDRLYGGSGEDAFILLSAAGTATTRIFDFQDGIDVINLRALDLQGSTLEEAGITLRQSGDNVLVDFGDDLGGMVLFGTDIADLDDADFLI